jgi:hypothetical protein
MEFPPLAKSAVRDAINLGPLNADDAPLLAIVANRVSATCVIACVLLFALWERSYWVADSLGRGTRTSSHTTVLAVSSNHGTLALNRLVELPTWNLPNGLSEK